MAEGGMVAPGSAGGKPTPSYAGKKNARPVGSDQAPGRQRRMRPGSTTADGDEALLGFDWAGLAVYVGFGRSRTGACVKKKNVINFVILLLCVLITLASIMNVAVDNTEVIAMAKTAACEGKPKCDMTQTAMMRLPIWQAITFSGGKQIVEVRCQRSLIAIGDYSCKVTSKQ
jgi:hypothetical protein